jgi:hypothetical protein
MRGAALGALAGAFIATGAAAQSDPRSPAVLAAVQAQLGGAIEPDARYAIAFGDLNDDHQQEAIVHLVDRGHCGTGGCTTFVLTPAADGWHALGRLAASRLPIYRLPDSHSGWFDLAVYVGGDGVQPGLRTVRFAKGHYAANPTKAPSVGLLPMLASPLLPVTSEFVGLGGQ